MSNPHPSPGSRPLEQLKVAELREELRKRGLSLKGVKKELFERLDEVIRKEQEGTLSSAPGGVEEHEGEHGISHLARQYNTSEKGQEGDGLLYLNDGENHFHDSALIVNNASPYVGASDATPVFMAHHKDTENLNTEFLTSEDNVTSINNMNSLSESALHTDVGRPEILVPESNADCSRADNQVAAENVAVIPKPDQQASGNVTILVDKGDNDVDLPEDSHQVCGNDVVMSESVSLAGSSLAGPVVCNMNSTVVSGPLDDNCAPGSEDAVVGKFVPVVQMPGVANIVTQGKVSLSSEAAKDVVNTSVSDDLLGVSDASLPALNFAAIANDSSIQDAKIIEQTVLTSVQFVPSVQESVHDGSGGVLKSEPSELLKDNLLVEEEKQVELLGGGEASIPTSADREALVAPPGVATLEAMQDPILPEVQQDIAMPESLQDSVMHEVVQQELVAQELPKDTEMLEAVESSFMKPEAFDMASDTKLPAACMDAPLDISVDIKSENLAADSNQLNEAARGVLVNQRKSNVKLEPMEAESRAGRRMLPIENVKVEQKDIKDDMRRSGRPYDRSRLKESEYERSRAEMARSTTYGNERTRAEGRSGRVFREERRQDFKERDSKPYKEESHDRSSQKRKDDDRDAHQQESAKRVRRWSSGNQMVVETAEALTTGIVMGITSSEVKKEGFMVPPPKPMPRSSGPSKPIPATVKANSEANGHKRAVPPSTRASTSSLKVERFVRPFTLKAVKDLLSEFGQCVDFWMDQIKTHCYVTYSKVDEAVAARNGLYNKQWPPSFGNLLVADFVDASEVKTRSDGSFEKMNAPPATTTPRGVPNQPFVQGVQPLGSFHGHSNSLASAPPLRERHLVHVPMKDPEPPVPTLDDLFRKTKAKPHIYYLPLTEEQVAEKLATLKNKEQSHARSKPAGGV